MTDAISIFMRGVITPTPSSGEFLVIVELAPAKNADSEKLCRLLRSGHPVRYRVREQPKPSPILISDVTSREEVVIRCRDAGQAQALIERLRAYPTK
jgi:hypothetical protein